LFKGIVSWDFGGLLMIPINRYARIIIIFNLFIFNNDIKSKKNMLRVHLGLYSRSFFSNHQQDSPISWDYPFHSFDCMWYVSSSPSLTSNVFMRKTLIYAKASSLCLITCKLLRQTMIEKNVFYCVQIKLVSIKMLRWRNQIKRLYEWGDSQCT
jgi:hypothetical protein